MIESNNPLIDMATVYKNAIARALNVAQLNPVLGGVNMVPTQQNIEKDFVANAMNAQTPTTIPQLAGARATVTGGAGGSGIAHGIGQALANMYNSRIARSEAEVEQASKQREAETKLAAAKQLKEEAAQIRKEDREFQFELRKEDRKLAQEIREQDPLYQARLKRTQSSGSGNGNKNSSPSASLGIQSLADKVNVLTNALVNEKGINPDTAKEIAISQVSNTSSNRVDVRKANEEDLRSFYGMKTPGKDKEYSGGGRWTTDAKTGQRVYEKGQEKTAEQKNRESYDRGYYSRSGSEAADSLMGSGYNPPAPAAEPTIINGVKYRKVQGGYERIK